MKKPSHDDFVFKHIGPSKIDTPKMLSIVGVKSIDELIDQTIPSDIAFDKKLNIPEAYSEHNYLKHIREIAEKNRLFNSNIGLGYYNCIVPSVISRNILENPGWYTQYTPYQAEISQGRLEALLNFQTVVCDLTGMEVANASLLDEGTAAAEAMTMAHRIRHKELVKNDANKFFVSDKCYVQTIDVLNSRSEPLGIELVVGNVKEVEVDNSFYGVLLQYPDSEGFVEDYSECVTKFHSINAAVVFSADLLSLAILNPPGEFGADIVVGSTQRLGVPMGYGGPNAAFFATKEQYKRQMPGRIIGVSQDKNGKKAYRMALQTREQHIRREKATSNICTAQALLAIMTSMYCVYHGPDGLREIATKIHSNASFLENKLINLGYSQINELFFDTLQIDLTGESTGLANKIKTESENSKINFWYETDKVFISVDETTSTEDIVDIVNVFAAATGKDKERDSNISIPEKLLPDNFKRKSSYLDHPVFNSHHSETKMLRYIKSLENKDLSLTYSMIPLGSCTMKLNATSEMIPISWPEFANQHPFAPLGQTLGYQEVFKNLERYLCEISGLSAASLQPNSGAQGEYAGLMVIRAYNKDKGEEKRNIVLVPSSAHGTNPASASIAGMDVVVIKCDKMGNIDLDDLKMKCEKYKENLSSIMVTYPSTHGVFENRINEVTKIVHESGGQVYVDGANLNAQVGLTSPGFIGADVCHINLHKTFSIPHGGGGPGMGPICVADHLAPYLPGHSIVDLGIGGKSIPAVSAAPWGSASILLISYAYLRMLGAEGSTDASKYAILNANYLKTRLEKYYPVLYKGTNGRVAHEFILDFRAFKKSANIDVEDIAKRLMDYGFHAPTMSWPVPGTLMIEPTESESMDELDRFCEALIEIRNEISEIENGEYSPEDNVLKNSPHTIDELISGKWIYSYSAKKAYYPLDYIRDNKFWPPVGRIDNAYGDKNLVCTCPPIEEYETE
jgi:glycine dehydrogenase